MKCSEIYPCATAHLLVNAESGGSASVFNSVGCIRYAARYCLIRYIDGVVAFYEYFRNPDSIACCRSVLCGFYHLVCSHAEWVLAIFISFASVRKTYATILPMVFADAFFVSTAIHDGIIVYDDFLFLPVAFSWCKYNCTSILKHRDEVGDNDGLCVEVFCGAEESWTLPNPLLFVVAEVFAVALPKAQVSALHAFLNGVRQTCGRHPWVAFEGFTFIYTSGVGLAHHISRDELLDGSACCYDGEVVGVVRCWLQQFYFGIDFVNGERSERLCYEVVAKYNGDAFLLVISLYVFDRYFF